MPLTLSTFTHCCQNSLCHPGKQMSSTSPTVGPSVLHPAWKDPVWLPWTQPTLWVPLRISFIPWHALDLLWLPEPISSLSLAFRQWAIHIYLDWEIRKIWIWIMAPPNTKNVTLGREMNIYNPWRSYVLNNKNVLNNTNGTNQWLSDLCVRITWETCENSGCPPPSSCIWSRNYGLGPRNMHYDKLPGDAAAGLGSTIFSGCSQGM